MFNKITNVSTNKDVSLNIELLADLHADKDTNLKNIEKYIKILKDNNGTDYIVILGDILNDGTDIETAKRVSDLIYKMGDIAPIIMILGNHDRVVRKNGKWYYITLERDMKKYNEIISLYNSIPNNHLLRNEEITFNDVNFYGVDIVPSYYKNMYGFSNLASNSLDNFYNISNDKYNIMLTHSPINFMDKKFIDENNLGNIDIFLAGHMHNGIVPYYLEWIFPNNLGLIGKNSEKFIMFPKLCKGNVNISESQTGVIANPLCTFASDKLFAKKLNLFYPMVRQTVKVRKLNK